MKYWKFAEIPRVENLSFNKVLERFYDYGVAGLIRENIQNSLDGKLINSEEPVKVVIKTGKMKKNHIPGMDEIEKHIMSLKGKNQYSKETIEHIQRSVINSEVNYLSFEDGNTRGLTGADQGYPSETETTYSAYAYSKGVHYEEDDIEVEKARGGSHGIGKIASNAASDIYLMFFANCDEFNNQHLGGNIQLIEHEFNGKSYRSTGYFTNIKGDNLYPYVNKKFSEVFSKKTRGLKIVIPYLRLQFNYEKEILTAICDSFFLAIIKNKLIIDFNDTIIDSNSIKSIIENNTYYEQKLEDIKKVFTPLYFKTFNNAEKFEITVKDRKKEEYHFELYFQYDTRISKGRTAIIRTIGMKIEDMKIKGAANKPFNAVLIPKTIREDSFLKSLENESHIELSSNHFKDIETQKNAKTFINKLNEEIRKIVENSIRKNNPTDGIIDTQDIIYDIENKFRSQLKKQTSVVKIGNKKLVKTKSASSEKKGDKEKNGEGKPKEDSIRKKKKKTYDGDSLEYLKINQRCVTRVIASNKEFLKIDLSGTKSLVNTDECDVHISIMDGNGDERFNEFDMAHDYLKVMDNQINRYVDFKDGVLKNVSMKNQTISLEMDISYSYNYALKFLYYLEV